MKNESTWGYLIQLPRHLLGLFVLMISYFLASGAKWACWLGAYLMDHEKYWRLHDDACKEKLGEIDVEFLREKAE